MFPFYLAIGMTAEQYWEQDCELVKYYRQAAKIRQELKNQDAWVQGAYFYEVMVKVAPIFRAFAKKGIKAAPYRSEPFDFYSEKDSKKKQEVEQKKDDKAKAYMEAFAASVNKKFQKKGGGVNG